MKERVSIGFFIRRTVRDVARGSGRAYTAYQHRLYVTRADAQWALDVQRGEIDPRYDYSISEAFMIIDEEQGQ